MERLLQRLRVQGNNREAVEGVHQRGQHRGLQVARRLIQVHLVVFVLEVLLERRGELLHAVGLQRSFVGTHEFRSQVLEPSDGGVVNVQVQGKDVRRLQHVVRLLEVLQLAEVVLLAFLRGSVRLLSLVLHLWWQVGVDLDEAGDGDGLCLRLPLLHYLVLYQV